MKCTFLAIFKSAKKESKQKGIGRQKAAFLNDKCLLEAVKKSNIHECTRLFSCLALGSAPVVS